MKKHICVTLILINLFLGSCSKNEHPDLCQPVSTITPKDQCYSLNQGLTLTATGQNTDQNKNQFVWYIYPQIDTSRNKANVSSSNERVVLGLDSVVIPDSILKGSSKFIVKVLSSCRVDQVSSPYVTFVKQENNSCIRWIYQP